MITYRFFYNHHINAVVNGNSNSHYEYKKVYGICKRKFKKLKRQKRLVYLPVSLYTCKHIYFDTHLDGIDITPYMNYDWYFNCSIKGRKINAGGGRTSITLFESDLHLRENEYKHIPENGFFIITKNKKETAKLTLML